MIRRTLWYSIALAGIAAAAGRFLFGLGAVTNLTDAVPWGLWVGCDILIGVATSAGGFAVAFVIYILGREHWQPIGRAAILTAFLGYAFSVGALMIDLGRPWAIWHALVYWNTHSVLFEVAWCMMLYNTILFVEVSPEIFGLFGLHSVGRRIHSFMPFFAGMGFLLSTLHQSSLGGLYLIVPGKLHEFWYTPLLPLLFFLSAVKCGIGMIILETSLTHGRLGGPYEAHELKILGRALVIALSVVGIVQVGDLFGRGVDFLSTPYEYTLLVAELGLGTLLPLVVLSGPRPPARLFTAAALAVAGVMLNRLNVSITGIDRWHNFSYVPSLGEFAVTLGLAVIGVALFRLMAWSLALYEPSTGPRVPLFDRVGALTLTAALAVLVAGAVSQRSAAIAAAPEVGRNELATRPDAVAAAGAGVVRLDTATGAFFPHAAHTMGCPACHTTDYRILPDAPRPDRNGHTGAICGRCHDGRNAFAMTGDCRLCHDAPGVGPPSDASPPPARDRDALGASR